MHQIYDESTTIYTTLCQQVSPRITRASVMQTAVASSYQRFLLRNNPVHNVNRCETLKLVQYQNVFTILCIVLAFFAQASSAISI